MQPVRYPLQFLHDFDDALHGCTDFSKLDCVKEYHQIPMARQDAEKTAIIMPVGMYQYKTIPFGLCNSGSTYQHLVDQVTRGLNFCFANVDDILIASRSIKEHICTSYLIVLESLYLRLNYEAKLQELVHLPNRVQF